MASAAGSSAASAISAAPAVILSSCGPKHCRALCHKFFSLQTAQYKVVVVVVVIVVVVVVAVVVVVGGGGGDGGGGGGNTGGIDGGFSD